MGSAVDDVERFSSPKEAAPVPVAWVASVRGSPPASPSMRSTRRARAGVARRAPAAREWSARVGQADEDERGTRFFPGQANVSSRALAPLAVATVPNRRRDPPVSPPQSSCAARLTPARPCGGSLRAWRSFSTRTRPSVARASCRRVASAASASSSGRPPLDVDRSVVARAGWSFRGRSAAPAAAAAAPSVAAAPSPRVLPRRPLDASSPRMSLAPPPAPSKIPRARRRARARRRRAQGRPRVPAPPPFDATTRGPPRAGAADPLPAPVPPRSPPSEDEVGALLDRPQGSPPRRGRLAASRARRSASSAPRSTASPPRTYPCPSTPCARARGLRRQTFARRRGAVRDRSWAEAADSPPHGRDGRRSRDGRALRRSSGGGSRSRTCGRSGTIEGGAGKNMHGAAAARTRRCTSWSPWRSARGTNEPRAQPRAQPLCPRMRPGRMPRGSIASARTRPLATSR